MNRSAPVILWYRADLRVDDHPALHAAVASGRPVIPAFVLDESPSSGRSPGSASRWWLHHSLDALAARIDAMGGQLILRRGPTHERLAQLVRESGATDIYFSRGYEPGDADLELSLQDTLGDQVSLHRYAGRLLFEPEALVKDDGTPYRVFTPFWKAALARPGPREPKPAPAAWPIAAELPSDALADWNLLPSRPDWAAGFREAWQPGEDGAAAALERFLEERVAGYKDDRDRPDKPGTSRLSAHLRWGEISPRRVWHAAQAHAVHTRQAQGTDAFLRELGWREFSSHLLHQFPALPEQPLRPEFAAFPWQDDEQGLARWQQGRTGYPIVDAGMRELWTTGWMHNRVRMIVASFLVKDLLLPWQRGEEWFWDTLVDADLANNSASWQWVAGCGADAAPFFRVFNPTLQGQKFDPDGTYVRRWIPELEGVPDKSVHTPWLARHAGTEYPEPMVDHAAARKRALAAFQTLKDKSAAA